MYYNINDMSIIAIIHMLILKYLILTNNQWKISDQGNPNVKKLRGNQNIQREKTSESLAIIYRTKYTNGTSWINKMRNMKAKVKKHKHS